jgi:hypothetical protein
MLTSLDILGQSDSYYKPVKLQYSQAKIHVIRMVLVSISCPITVRCVMIEYINLIQLI